MPQPVKRGLFLICPKTGAVIGCRVRLGAGFILRAGGCIALLWYLVRVVPKPSRAAYPCQRAAAPLAFGFLAYLASCFATVVAVRHAGRCFRRQSFTLGLVCLLLGLAAAGWNLTVSSERVEADFVPPDVNTPIGLAKGMHPGRVAWVHDPESTSWDGVNGNWWTDEHTDQFIVDEMLSRVLRICAGQTTDAAAWDALFRHFNQTAGKGDVGYVAGETIVVKINMNNRASGNMIDASPHMVRGLLRQLVHGAGVAQEFINVYDAQRPIGSPVLNACQPEFPTVGYNANIGWVENAISYSAEVTSSVARRLPQCVIDADYMINMAILKRHDLMAPVTLCAKNHFGTVGSPSALHTYVKSWTRSMGSYDPLVDLTGCEHLGGKTMLYIIDGLYGSYQWNGTPIRWSGSPFFEDWPSSVLCSQDPVAIDSVGLDLLRAQWPLRDNADNSLHEAAEAGSPPSGIFYDPDSNGTGLTSQGVHEHWNNSVDREYSRNLGTGNGIELVYRFVEPDLDRDGMADPWEVNYFGSTTNSAGGITEDWDGDGYCDRDECVAGTNPTNSASYLKAELSLAAPGDLLIQWEGVSNRFYDLERSSGPQHESWTLVSGDLPAVIPLNVVTEELAGASPANYRLRVRQGP